MKEPRIQDKDSKNTEQTRIRKTAKNTEQNTQEEYRRRNTAKNTHEGGT